MKQFSIATDLNIDFPLNQRKNCNPFFEAGQLRRAKMHASRFIEALDIKRLLTPSMYQLLEASLILESTNTRVLAFYLKRTPANIRKEFEKICATLGRYEEFSKDFYKQPPP
ncbi:hypothetical protein [Nitrosomonas supralitoralis]|uniref:Uncharacterized protein n=1 Tax=Nitrosomonas supralitoralis TaxID=2116706 RepID=A0A2P7NXD1_9PROT|nr:hypothetical protein [Nitrosomonas supralitoralis]PSJ18123.1 hypothetical protein C7H79_04510 [Nitrosomonas supralitoralis]